jgi:hypothetical protein
VAQRRPDRRGGRRTTIAAPTAGVDDVDDREWPRPPRHASKYANSFRPGGGDYIGNGEFAVATDYDDVRRRRHRRFGVVGRWRMTRTVGVIAVVAVVAVVVVGGVHAVVVGGVLFAEEGRQAGPIDSSHPSPP